MEYAFSSPSSISLQLHDLYIPKNPNTDEDEVTSNMKHTDIFTLESLSEFILSEPNKMDLSPFCEKQFDQYFNELAKNLNNQGVKRLSTEGTMRLAAERFIQFSTQTDDDDLLAVSINPYDNDLSDLSMEDLQNVELARLLLSTVEKISTHKYERASKLLSRCELMSSSTGNPVERVVYYFAEALREKIDKQIGRKSGTTKNADKKIDVYYSSLASGSGLEFIALHQALPFMQAYQFAAMQSILEKIGSAKKVHLIDLQLRTGIHWTTLMQALASRDKSPIKFLKLTAVGTTNRQAIEGTCERLASFAKSINLPFCYKVVFVSDMIDITVDQFEVELDQTVVVFSQSALMLMLPKASCLDNLMALISKIKPELMVVIELEANQNSPSFVKRFTEALFFNSAYFDCLESCMDRENKYRMMMEGMYFREGIRNVVATDGEERVKRCVTINVWRKFFTRFRMVENQPSELSISQARMVVNLFDSESGCSVDRNGKCLMFRWKGTPLHSLSTWRFS